MFNYFQGQNEASNHDQSDRPRGRPRGRPRRGTHPRPSSAPAGGRMDQHTQTGTYSGQMDLCDPDAKSEEVLGDFPIWLMGNYLYTLIFEMQFHLVSVIV